MRLSTFLLLIAPVIIILYIFVGKLYHFKGGGLRKRMYSLLGLSLFFTLATLGYSEKDITVIGRGIVLGSILCLPFYYFTKRDMEKRIKGNIIYYKHRHLFKNFLLAASAITITHILFRTNIGRQILITNGVILGLCFAWFISQIFILIYIAKLERKLGTSILEDIEDKST
jgi:hypothetical protein